MNEKIEILKCSKIICEQLSHKIGDVNGQETNGIPFSLK